LEKFDIIIKPARENRAQSFLAPGPDRGPQVHKEVQEMAKLNGNYEALYVIDPRKNEEEATALMEKFKALVESNATAVEVNDWGSRSLAYPIDDQTTGHYVLVTFTCPSAFPAELDRIFRITDGIMRSIIVCKDEA